MFWSMINIVSMLPLSCVGLFKPEIRAKPYPLLHRQSFGKKHGDEVAHNANDRVISNISIYQDGDNVIQTTILTC